MDFAESGESVATNKLFSMKDILTKQRHNLNDFIQLPLKMEIPNSCVHLK